MTYLQLLSPLLMWQFVLRRIAQDTGYVAVAFPALSGQWFMSNHKAIEDYLEDNYIKSSKGAISIILTRAYRRTFVACHEN